MELSACMCTVEDLLDICEWNELRAVYGGGWEENTWAETCYLIIDLMLKENYSICVKLHHVK